jgi:hypothetical protein
MCIVTLFGKWINVIKKTYPSHCFIILIQETRFVISSAASAARIILHQTFVRILKNVAYMMGLYALGRLGDKMLVRVKVSLGISKKAVVIYP